MLRKQTTSRRALFVALLVCQTGFFCRADEAARTLKTGPYLFIDDDLIAECEGLQRTVTKLQRFLDEPVVTSGPEHRNWQPWLTVTRYAERSADKPFRMWYCADVNPDNEDLAFDNRVAYLESADGIRWPGPYRTLEKFEDPLFGASVVDDGPQAAVPSERYKMIYWPVPTPTRNGPLVAFSADGLSWTSDGRVIMQASPGGDSWHAAYDPLRERYYLIGKSNQIHEWTNAEGIALRKRLRLYGTSTSRDFKNWTKFKMLDDFKPDAQDPGVTEWYGAVGFQIRGNIIVGFLQVLRDDLTCEGAPAEAVAANVRLKRTGAGMGHTVLCWTRDGENWYRDRQSDAVLEPNPIVGTWDHAMAWASSVVPVGDELFVYYGGYRWGHKYRRSEDRQVGLVKMRRDRYVARAAGETLGRLVTKPMIVAAATLTVNVHAAGGELRARLLDGQGRPIPGYDFADGPTITVDALDVPLDWKTPLKAIAGQSVQIEFALRNAKLYALGAR